MLLLVDAWFGSYYRRNQAISPATGGIILQKIPKRTLSMKFAEERHDILPACNAAACPHSSF